MVGSTSDDNFKSRLVSSVTAQHSGTVRNGAPSTDDNDNAIARADSPYIPKQSTRLKEHSKAISADNDTWIENYALVEVEESNGILSSQVTRKYVIRSFFESRETGNRTWDEPPSGASNIQYATEEMRRMAQMQLQNEPRAVRSPDRQRTTGKTNERKRSGIFAKSKLFKSTSGNKDSLNARESALPETNEMPPSSKDTSASVKALRQEQAKLQRKEYERQMQLAMAQSLEDPNAASLSRSGTSFKGRDILAGYHFIGDENDQVAIAEALSISEAEALKNDIARQQLDDEREEELVRLAIELSKADMATEEVEGLLGLKSDQLPQTKEVDANDLHDFISSQETADRWVSVDDNELDSGCAVDLKQQILSDMDRLFVDDDKKLPALKSTQGRQSNDAGEHTLVQIFPKDYPDQEPYDPMNDDRYLSPSAGESHRLFTRDPNQVVLDYPPDYVEAAERNPYVRRGNSFMLRSPRVNDPSAWSLPKKPGSARKVRRSTSSGDGADALPSMITNNGSEIV